MVDEALEPNLHQHVVTDDTARKDQTRQGLGAAQDPGAGGLAAARATDADGLADLEGSMLQGHSGAPEGLLHPQGSAADGAWLGWLGRPHQQPGRAQRLLVILGLHGSNLAPHRCERRERDRAVFFTSP